MILHEPHHSVAQKDGDWPGIQAKSSLPGNVQSGSREYGANDGANGNAADCALAILFVT